jgi:hypothetical protein
VSAYFGCRIRRCASRSTQCTCLRSGPHESEVITHEVVNVSNNCPTVVADLRPRTPLLTHRSAKTPR